jgi:hypothetical protein
MATSHKAQIAPTVNSKAWKTFVADAMAKHPDRRSNAEREAVAVAMAMHEAGKAQKH